MQLRDYLRTIRSRWLIIASAVVIATVLAAFATSQMTKQYASSSRIFISTTTSDSGNALQGSTFTEERVASYVDILGGRELAQRVIDQLNLQMSAAELSSKISASVVTGTVVLQITVTDTDPRRAQQINESVITQLQSFVKELETPPGKTLPLLKASVVDSPDLPTAPTSPKPTRNLALGMVLGLLLGLGLAVLREVLDTTVKQVEDVESLREVPLLATLGYDSEMAKRPLLTSIPRQSPRSEAFRVLRTNLSFIDVDSRHKAYVITSSVPGEGKTTTAVNVAIAIANSGERVLLIDGDLRRPQVADLLGLEGAVGLTTTLVGSASLNDTVQNHEPSGLRVLTSGRLPPNPAELLQSRAMGDLLEQVRSIFDVVIIDAPPLLPVTDAALMSTLTDGAIVVVRHGETTKAQLGEAIRRLIAVNSPPLGVIMNMVRSGLPAEYGYGYASAQAVAGEAALRRKKPRRGSARTAVATGPPRPEDTPRKARSHR